MFPYATLHYNNFLKCIITWKGECTCVITGMQCGDCIPLHARTHSLTHNSFNWMTIENCLNLLKLIHLFHHRTINNFVNADTHPLFFYMKNYRGPDLTGLIAGYFISDIGIYETQSKLLGSMKKSNFIIFSSLEQQKRYLNWSAGYGVPPDILVCVFINVPQPEAQACKGHV